VRGRCHAVGDNNTNCAWADRQSVHAQGRVQGVGQSVCALSNCTCTHLISRRVDREEEGRESGMVAEGKKGKLPSNMYNLRRVKFCTVSAVDHQELRSGDVEHPLHVKGGGGGVGG
jgi:hypothetical protein